MLGNIFVMKISYSWLKDYVELRDKPDTLADILTDIGLEVDAVENYESVIGGLSGLVIGLVQDVRKHPNADRLTVTEVSIGNGDNLQIVCGAPNVAVGQKVVIAPVDVKIFPTKGKPIKIKKTAIRGEDSYGMICAEDEIGLGESHDGIMELPEDAPVGSPLSEFIIVERDIIFDIALTPNRSDAFSHIGVARDLVAYYNSSDGKQVVLSYPTLGELIKEGNDSIEVVVEDHDACPRYSGILLDNIEVKESPDWLQHKLKSIDLRPINNIVDITNFVLHEMGQPLHAFDADKISGNKVVVKKLPDNSKFVALDEVERKLSSEDLMICDSDKGMCIGGVFGGLSSGVTESTKRIFLESANFNPVSIRKSALRHNLRTDAASRFEKGIDPNSTITALSRAVDLMKKYAGARISGDLVDIYPDPAEPATIKLNLDWFDKIAGVSIKREIIRKILSALEINVSLENGSELELKIPTYRTDVTRPADMVEEILRIYGYNNIPDAETFHISLSDLPINYDDPLKKGISSMLTGSGFAETVSLSFAESAFYKGVGKAVAGKSIRLVNSISTEMDILRPSMISSILPVVAHNLNRRNLNLRLFEFGYTYHENRDEYEETAHLCLTITGKVQQSNWKTPDHSSDFYHLKQAVHGILRASGIDKYEVKEVAESAFKQGLTYKSAENQLVTFGSIESSLTGYYEIDQEVWLADFNWDQVRNLSDANNTKYTEVPKYPAIRRDLALILNKATKYSEVEDIAVKTNKKLLKEINLFDIYEDDKIGAEKKSYAVSFLFQHNERTLTDQEVDDLMQKLIVRYEKKLNATIRK